MTILFIEKITANTSKFTLLNCDFEFLLHLDFSYMYITLYNVFFFSVFW